MCCCILLFNLKDLLGQLHFLFLRFLVSDHLNMFLWAWKVCALFHVNCCSHLAAYRFARKATNLQDGQSMSTAY